MRSLRATLEMLVGQTVQVLWEGTWQDAQVEELGEGATLRVTLSSDGSSSIINPDQFRMKLIEGL